MHCHINGPRKNDVVESMHDVRKSASAIPREQTKLLVV
jgi:hypothetical protein